MNVRWLILAFFLAQLVACSGSNFAGTRPSNGTTICALAVQGQEKGVGDAFVRFHATYITDLRHGAFFMDASCPSLSIQYVADAVNADPSVQRFNDAVEGSILDRDERKYSVDVSGKLTWSSGGKPHGSLTLFKVWSYERTLPK